MDILTCTRHGWWSCTHCWAGVLAIQEEIDAIHNMHIDNAAMAMSGMPLGGITK